MTSAPVPITFAIKTWPRFTGRAGRSLAISARMGKIISRGTPAVKRTEIMHAEVPMAGIDVARFRLG